MLIYIMVNYVYIYIYIERERGREKLITTIQVEGMIY